MQANEEPVGKNQYRVKGLPVGEKMLFRVSAVNIAGRSPPATLTQAVTVREIMGQRHVFSYRHILNRSCCCCRETKRWHQYLCARRSRPLVNLTTGSLHIMFHIYVYLHFLHHTEHPKIRLPRHLRTKHISLVGEKVNLVIPFQVSPSLAELWLFSASVEGVCTCP